jgi:5-oxoprolinase (ATP-hydrolysing)
MREPRWQFWIDVGGTFTDCIGRRPDGLLVRHKVLSSGVVKGVVSEHSTESEILDPLRSNDPQDFWAGYLFRLLDANGDVVSQSTVSHFDPRRGALQLDSPLAVSRLAGHRYELTAGQEAPILAIRYLLGLPLAKRIPPCSVRLGATRGTNALLTRRGGKTAFITTRGFGDILHIGYQNRPRLFDLAIRKPPPLFAAVMEVDERVTAEGEVLHAPDREAIRAGLAALKEQGIESLAVCLLHAYRFAEHEAFIERLARELGFEEISLSSRTAPLIKIVSRGDTTVVDAYLNPVLRRYVDRLRSALGDDCDLRLLTSAGSLVSPERFLGKDSILSGPAGGVVGFSRVAEAAGFPRAIGFDMGGTSTDVSRYDGRFELEYETEKAGVRVVAPMMAIETVAAGGGSICRFDGVKLAVGPDSAGADPGPACYGRGGPLAVTDVNFFLGRIRPEHFPFPLQHGAVESRLAELIEAVECATGRRYEPAELAEGFVRVANANMAKAIRTISIAKGYDPRDYVLAAFGGAAGQHACAVAEELGMNSILNHPDAGVLSAYGIGMADVVRRREQGVYRAYSEEEIVGLGPTFDSLIEEARRDVLAERVLPERIEVRRLLDLRYRGRDAYLTIPEPERGTYAEAYVEEHRRLYGYVQEGRELEIVAVRIEVIGRSEERPQRSTPLQPRDVLPMETATAFFGGQPCLTGIYRRQELRPGDRIAGPAIIVERLATTVIDPGWRAESYTGGELVIRRKSDACSSGKLIVEEEPGASAPRLMGGDTPDPVLLEIFNNQFAGVAQQMGVTLRNTASSVNVKERFDFSCAVFTPEGDLVVNAPHIPVHLGAMSETVKRIVADNPAMNPGDVFVTNDPYRGGSHLPDVTVVTPVHAANWDGAPAPQLLFFTASRAHHAEIGGVAPGSMPPFSTNLAEEGVLIRNLKAIDAGRSRMDELRRVLESGPYPSRAVEDNLADLAAQIAANQQGVRDLLAMVERYTLPVVHAYMRHIQNAAEQKMRSALAKLPPGRREFTDYLDDGSPICAAITIRGDSATIDFTGTGPVLPGNLNANRAIVTAAVMYCLRCLIAEEIPLNQGVLAPIELIVPECLLNPPERASPEACAAVVGGNVETSQRVVDAILGALDVAAASQGTMNNLLFGDATFGYYETICGGSGATPDGPGADAVHTHMTNTRLTDPEVLEQRFPVRVREFRIRRGSGGAGHHRGGDGVLRQIEFLRPLSVSLLTQRRGPYAPYGLAGGQPGALGQNTLLRPDGAMQSLPALAQFQAAAGDILQIETPGGGGWGGQDCRDSLARR